MDGQGLHAPSDPEANCNGPTEDCPVPPNVAIELRFDRFLLPYGLEWGLSLYSGNPPANGIGLRVEYDMIERVVIYRPTRLLQPNTLYTAELISYPQPGQGFWAVDGAPLREAAVPLRFSFKTSKGPPEPPPDPSPEPETCQAMLQGPLASCAGCHVTQANEQSSAPASSPPMGLDLASARGLNYTAIRQIAHQTETGNSAIGPALQSSPRFGVQMNIVDPGSPATSYLMYKLLRKPQNFGAAGAHGSCLTGYHAPVSDLDCQPPPESELTQLREWWVLGDPMPKDPSTTTGETIPAATTREDLVRIARWIKSGAACPDAP